MSKTLWMMVGVPGSGKTWFAKHKLIQGLGWRYVSRDEVRFSIITDEDEYFSKEKEVFREFINRIKAAFNDDGIFNVVADATHLNWPSRRKLINAIGVSDINIIPVVIQSNIEDSIQRNEEREGRAVVPRSVMRQMNASLTDPKTDDFKYTAIMYVDNSIHHYTEKPQFMYHKNDIKMKEIPIKDMIKK